MKVYNKYASNSGGYKFPVGNVNLRGEQALAYVRERKQLPHGDLDRAERQRVVLQAILAKGLAKETITNPFKFVNFVRGVSQHVSVDDGLTESKLRKTALSLRLVQRRPPAKRPFRGSAPAPPGRASTSSISASWLNLRSASERPDGQVRRELPRG